MAKMLTKTEVESGSLFDALAERLNADRDELLEKVVGDQPDSKRFYTGNLRVAVWARDDGFCRHCGVRLDPSAWEADHLVPHARGGRTTLENGAASCKPCNNAKSDDWW